MSINPVRSEQVGERSEGASAGVEGRELGHPV